MKILLQKIYDKGSGSINEDEFLIKDNLFAVFDGASSLVKFKNEKRETGGKLAAKIVKKVFSKNERPLKQLAIDANNTIHKEMKKYNINIDRKEGLWSTHIAAVRLLNRKAEFLSIGDCLMLAIFNNGEYRLLVPYHDHDLETMKKWKNLSGKKVKSIRDKLKAQMDKVRRDANITYGILNGKKEAVKFLKTGKIHLKNVKSIVIFTDGLFIPKEYPEESESWDFFVQLYQKSGLNGILKYVRSLEKTDPNCWKYPRFKQHDDIAAIGIDFL